MFCNYVKKFSSFIIISAISFAGFNVVSADTFEDLQTNSLRKVISLDGTWQITPPARTDNVSAWNDDPVYKAGWPVNKPLDGATETTVPLNMVYPWTGRKPVWNPADPIPQNPLEGCLSLWGVGKLGQQFFKDKSHIVVWYRRDFTAALPGDCRRQMLCFGGVGNVAEVFLNGKYVGRHDGTFTSFMFDVTGCIKEGINTLAVRCIIRRGGDHLSNWGNTSNMYMGLWRGVSLLETPSTAIRRVLIDPDPVNKKISYRLRLNSPSQKNMLVTTEICEFNSAAGKSDVSLARSQSVLPAGAAESRFDLPFTGPLWTPENPNMLEMKITLREQGNEKNVIDEYRVPFGFRSFKAAEKKLLLNGQPYRLIGYGEDGNHFGGEGYSDKDVYARYLALCKVYHDTCANVIRWHNPMIPQQARAADVTGLGVYQGMDGSPELFKDMQDDYWTYLRDYVEEYYNHPSILMWHWANERWYDETIPLMNKIYDVVRAADTSGRPVIPDSGSYSFPGLPGLEGRQDVIDVHNYSGVTFGSMGSTQRVPFTETTDVVMEIIERTNRIFRNVPKPLIFGEVLQTTTWRTMLPENWKGPDKGGQHRKIIGTDGLVRLEIFDEIRDEYREDRDLGHCVKQHGLIDFLMCGKQNIPQAGHLHQWTDDEVIKDCMEQYRLLPTYGIFRNGGKPILEKSSSALGDYPSAKLIFGRLQPIMTDLPRQIFSGQKMSIKVCVDNFTPEIQKGLSVKVRLDAEDGKNLYEGALLGVPEILPQQQSFVSAELTSPENASGPAIVRLLLFRDGKQISQNFYHVSLTPRSAIAAVNSSKKLVIWRPEKYDISPLEKILRQLNITHSWATTKKLLDDLSDKNKSPDWVLLPPGAVLGPNACTDEFATLAKSLNEWLNNGGNVLILEQFDSGKIPLTKDMQILRADDNITADPVVFDNPVLRKVTWDKWWLWKGRNGSICSFAMPLTKNTLAVIGAHMDNNVYSIFSEGTVGKGRVIVSLPDAVSRWGDDAAASLYLRELLDYALCQKMWNRIQPWESISTDYIVPKREGLTCVNLKPYFNQTWIDRTPREDRRGGWTDEGPNDFRHFSPPRLDQSGEFYQNVYTRHLAGKAWMLGLPFDISKHGNTEKSCIVVGTTNSTRMMKGIRINARAKTIFFLGTATYNGKGEFTVHYDDGSKVKIPIKFPDWWSGTNDGDVRIAWKGINPVSKAMVKCYIQPWQNPYPDKTISTLDIEGSHIILLGITLYSEKP